MNKKALALAAGACIMLAASCTQETNVNTDTTNVDSLVNARVDSLRTDMMMRNDSTIMAMATFKADSMYAAMTGKPAPRRPATGGNTGGTKPTTPATPTPTSGGKYDQTPSDGKPTSGSKYDQTPEKKGNQPTSGGKYDQKK